MTENGRETVGLDGVGPGPRVVAGSASDGELEPDRLAGGAHLVAPVRRQAWPPRRGHGRRCRQAPPAAPPEPSASDPTPRPAAGGRTASRAGRRWSPRAPRRWSRARWSAGWRRRPRCHCRCGAASRSRPTARAGRSSRSWPARPRSAGRRRFVVSRGRTGRRLLATPQRGPGVSRAPPTLYARSSRAPHLPSKVPADETFGTDQDTSISVWRRQIRSKYGTNCVRLGRTRRRPRRDRSFAAGLADRHPRRLRRRTAGR